MKITRVRPQHGRYYFIEDLPGRNPKTGRPLQKWHRLTRVDEGERALLDALGALLGQPVQDRPRGNLPALLEDFKKHWLPGLSSAIVRGEYDRMFDVIADDFADFNVDQVTPGVVLQFLTRFAGKANTRGKYKARLSSFFSWCVLQGHCTVNPCREIKLKAPPKRRGKLNAAKFWAIHDALTPVGQGFLLLLYFTRQRPTDVRLLRESQIGDDYIHFVPTKTEDSTAEEVDIRITPEIRAVLNRLRTLRPARKVVDIRDDPYLIQTRDGDHYTKNGLYEVWRDAVEAAGCKGITTRDVRPFALHQMEAAGYDLREIQLAAAHSTVTTTEGYLDQHRPRISDAVVQLPERPKA